MRVEFNQQSPFTGVIPEGTTELVIVDHPDLIPNPIYNSIY